MLPTRASTGPPRFGVGLQLGELIGFEWLLGASDDQEREVFGDRVLDQVQLDHLAADRGQARPPDADPRPGGIEIGGRAIRRGR